MIEKYLNRIIQGDAIAVLREIPDCTVDAIITDPPYCSGGRSISQRQQATSKKYENKYQGRPDFAGDAKDSRAWMRWCNMWISECERIMKPGAYFLAFSDWRQLPTATDAIQIGGISWRGIITWDKGLGSRAPHKGYFRHQSEFIVWGTKGACYQKENGPWAGVYEFHVRQSDKFHIAGKPTPLMEKLVQIVPEGAVIVDPFAGSGTTCIAAKRHRRNYIGIEKMGEYHKVALRRLALES
ncbi:DNA methyltransferase [Selenomonas artemidis]|jgi:adenine DNA methyltransferase|uniref:DNA-methyltransferase n=1 Tax=Selenomonas artemidis TaxID=671224 RepID=UPI0028EA2E9A|nr:DNA methyltransferase [Selenomonas artemidis]